MADTKRHQRHTQSAEFTTFTGNDGSVRLGQGAVLMGDLDIRGTSVWPEVRVNGERVNMPQLAYRGLGGFGFVLAVKRGPNGELWRMVGDNGEPTMTLATETFHGKVDVLFPAGSLP